MSPMTDSYSLISIMGLNVKRAFRWLQLQLTYLASGIVGNVVSKVRSSNPMVRASGDVLGLVAVYYTFLTRNQNLFGWANKVQNGALIKIIRLNLLWGMTNLMIDDRQLGSPWPTDWWHQQPGRIGRG